MARSASALALLWGSLLLGSNLIYARNLDSCDLAVGDWNLTMRCKKSSFAATVFPPEYSTDKQDEQSRQRRRHQRGWLSQRDASRSFDCRLSLFSNGTFALQPKDEDYWSRLTGHERVAILPPPKDTAQGKVAVVDPPTPLPPLYVPIQGRWKVDENPYCVTDRSYDQVTLTSRQRVQTRTDRKENSSSQKPIIETQRLQLLLQCRLSGHYTDGGVLRRLQGAARYARGRMVRGVVLLHQHHNSLADSGVAAAAAAAPAKATRPPRGDKVVASFSARRYIPDEGSMFEMAEDDDDILDEDD